MGTTAINGGSLLVVIVLVLIPVSKPELLPQSLPRSLPRSLPLPMPNPLPPESYHPFCISQFALANHACAPIRYGPVPQLFSSLPTNPPFSLTHLPGVLQLHRAHHHSNGHSNGHGHSSHSNGHSHSHSHNSGHSHSHRHHDNNHNHNNHHHKHHHKHHDLETEAAQECCKWLKAVNDYCVCDLLVHLPSFLSRPIHGFTVVIDDVCKVDYKCPGRFMTSR